MSITIRLFNTVIHVWTESFYNYIARNAIHSIKVSTPIKKGNPTPRKCRGHKIPFDIENGKCMRCGGVR